LYFALQETFVQDLLPTLGAALSAAQLLALHDKCAPMDRRIPQSY
jgi:hypothetical protein